jgi:hypothetical protein
MNDKSVCKHCGWQLDHMPIEQAQVALLADEINQFAMSVESFSACVRADRWISPSLNAQAHAVFNATRRLRERIAVLIDE